jgi:quercetin dioxygenase-like cupin family protein
VQRARRLLFWDAESKMLNLRCSSIGGSAMTTPSPAYGLNVGEAEPITMLDTQQLVLAGASTGASFTLLSADMPPGSAPPPHIHDDEDEAFYVLAGSLRVRCADEEWVLGPGGFAFLPRGVIHQPSVEGDDPAQVLIITSRPGLDVFFKEVAQELSAAGRPPDLHLLDRLGLSHGLRHFPPGTL